MPHPQKKRKTKLNFAHPWPSHCVSGSVPDSSVWPLSDSTPATLFTHYCNTYIRVRAFPWSTAKLSTVLCTPSSSRQDLRRQMETYGSCGKIMCQIKTRSDIYGALPYSNIRSKHSQNTTQKISQLFSHIWLNPKIFFFSAVYFSLNFPLLLVSLLLNWNYASHT